ncbi:fibronectin type III domain-containing protein [Luteolibacter luteus]|uniref:Carbohydrate-binding protein n=1 Tax=Luteolibacter luteus TaxID=2728835 RepID=A0A858RM36_9BACT|nr:PQQ-dependent sugar dehydrogenase [Luteolibacter luteus]QJE97053.1 hypothetical protein HHL09_15080 [Luteolibacter luteus]
MHSPRLLHLRHLCLYGSTLLAVVQLALGTSPSGLNGPEPVGPFFNGTFPATAPGDPSGWAVENAFPNLTFTDPMMLAEIPGQSQFLVVGKNGKIWRFPKSSAATMAQRIEVLDHTAKTETSEDQGFYSLAFHPNFSVNGAQGQNKVYVCYSRRAFEGVDDNDRTYWTVSQFTWLPSLGTLDPNSESILISQYDPHRFHNGGATFFGDDGFLYITVGDGGLGGDALDNSQRINVGLFGGMLRIDVNNDPAKSHAIRRQPTEDSLWEINPRPAEWPASFTQGYGIPNTNPFQNAGGSVLEEFYAIGLRSPHSAHFDSQTDEIWVGEVGEGNREELTRVANGSNCQWAYKEGTRNTSKIKPSPLIGTEMIPVHEYDHSVGSSIIGGMRYRGTKWASYLADKVIFGDHVRGRIWSLELTSGAPIVTEMVSSFDTGYKKGLCGFFTDSAGEIYIMNLAGTNSPNGKIMKLALPAISAEPPQLLSQTGVFTNLATLSTAAGVIPYDVPNPLWSDAAAKKRWVILPNNGSFDTPAEDIVFSEEGNWGFPAGTVFVKHFEVSTSASDPSAVKRLETRFLVCTANGGKYGFTYKWNETGTDAELMEHGLEEAYSFTKADNSIEQRLWTFPSRGDCMICHNDTSGQALGFRTAPLNSNYHYAATGRTANQLATLNSLGAFNVTLTATQLANYIEARGLDDQTAPLEHRVRSYLDTNCSHCHQPGGAGDGFDARLGTPLNLQDIINGIPDRYESLGPDGRYVVPGNPSLSAIFVRAGAVDNGDAMPPLAKHMAHANGIAVLRSYIDSLTPSQFVPPLGSGPQARFVRLTSLSGKSRFAAVGEFSILDADGVAIHPGQASVTYTKGGVAATSMPGCLPSEASDGNLGSSTNFWQSYKGTTNAETPAHPHELTFDLGTSREIAGYIYYPRPTSDDGRIFQYKVEYSTDGTNWTTFDSGTWANVATPQTFAPGYNKRATRAQIAGPSQSVARDFDVTVVFDMDVTDFTPSDLQVTGGTVSSLRGSGYYYVASISPASGAANVSVSVPANVVNPQGKGSFASGMVPVTIITDTTAPSDPTGLVATPTLLSVGLSWDASTDDVAVTGYQIRRGATLLATVPGTSYTDSGLDYNTPYTYSVTAVDAAGNVSGAIQISTATLPDLTAPSSPQNLTATPNTGSVELAWAASTDDVGVDAYQITRDNVVVATVQNPGFIDSGLQSGTTYNYKVVALDEANNASEPAMVSSTTLGDSIAPSPPADLAAAPALTSVTLTWLASTDNVEVTGYRVKRGSLTVATVTELSHTDTGLNINTPYEYQVIALDAQGNESTPATVVTATLADTQAPARPLTFTATPSTQSVQLSWTASTDNVEVTGYRVKRGNLTLATVPGLGYTDVDLDPDTSYDYHLIAVDGNGNESLPATLSTSTLADTAAPTTPDSLVAAPSVQSVQLSWGASSDNIAVTGYRILRNGTVIATVQSLAYNDAGLQPDTSYSYQVIAVDAADNASAAATVSTSTLSDSSAPEIPGDLAATPQLMSIQLVWSVPADNVGVTGYEVRRDGQLLATVEDPAYIDTGLQPATAYSYDVRARDAAGNISSPALLGTSTLEDTANPSLPGNLNASPEYHSVALIWDASSDNVGVISYEIWRDAELIGSVLNPSYLDSGLADGTTYVFKVIAVDAAGNKSAAAEVQVETKGFEDWLDENNLPGAVAGDSDGGSLDNLTEYYLGMNPNDSADDLGFRILCVPTPNHWEITFPKLVPRGSFHLHVSESIENIGSPLKRVLTITSEEIEQMTPAERSTHIETITPPGARGFFQLFFEPDAD